MHVDKWEKETVEENKNNKGKVGVGAVGVLHQTDKL